MTYKRPPLSVRCPDRSAGGLYRLVSDGKTQRPKFGVPVTSYREAVNAAVQTGHRLVNATLERSKEISDEFTSGSSSALIAKSRKVIDSGEMLAQRAAHVLKQGIGSLTEPSKPPMQTLLRAEFAALGGLLGLDSKTAATLGETIGTLQQLAALRTAGGPHGGPAPKIAFADQERALELVKWQLDPKSAQIAPDSLTFRHSTDFQLSLKVTVRVSDGNWTLLFRGLQKAQPGRWKASICNAQKEQVGLAEIIL